MKKKLIIITLVLILVLSGCSKLNQEKANNIASVAISENDQQKTNYIAPIVLSEREQELMNIVAPDLSNYILCEFDASDYKQMSMQIEKYKYGELVESCSTNAVISDSPLGKGKLFMEFNKDKFDLRIYSSMGKMTCTTLMDEDIKSAFTLYNPFDEPISLTENEKILFYKAYSEENATSMNGYNTEDLMRDGNIDQYPLCYVVKLVVE